MYTERTPYDKAFDFYQGIQRSAGRSLPRDRDERLLAEHECKAWALSYVEYEERCQVKGVRPMLHFEAYKQGIPLE